MSIKKEFVFLIWGCFSMILFGLSSIIISVMSLFMHGLLIGTSLVSYSQHYTDGMAPTHYYANDPLNPGFVIMLHSNSILTTSLLVSIVTFTFSALLVIGVLTKNAVMVKAYFYYGILILAIAKTSFMINKTNKTGIDFYGYSYFIAIGSLFFVGLGFAIRESCILCRKLKSTMNLVPQKQDDITDENITGIVI